MRSLVLLIALFILLAGCASMPDPIKEARENVAAGRGDQALAALDKAARDNPQRLDYRNEFFRVRDLVVAQWLAQAETLRGAGQPEGAAILYRRVQKYDAANPRARVGLEQLDADARHRSV